MDIAAAQSRLAYYKSTLCLAYQSLGVVYGDLSTSPIYVYKSTFSGRLRLFEEDHEILGVLSLIIWTLTLISLCKYVIFVLSADDKGEGGTFALYSLLCRHSNMGLLHTFQAGHPHGSFYDDVTSSRENKISLAIKAFFEKHQNSRVVLLLVVLLGTSMVIGDGILTPTMSVLSAVSGLKIKVPHLNEYYTVSTACVILMILFSLQHYGTRSVGFLFAPILVAWLLCLAGVGLYNVVHWNPRVIRAVSPYYIYDFFRITGKAGWSSLGGVVLSITGTEAMFADLGHFSQCSLRMAFAGFVYPCLLLAYMGEAAYLSKHTEDLQRSFYKAIPETFFWPFLIIATLATVVASQAVISAAFSIISQCRALKCFPRVKIVHTSDEIHGRIYIPEVNWALMVLCLAVVLGFRDTDSIGNAYVELLYLSACLAKVHRGGWVPLVSSLVILCLMSIWKYGTIEKLSFEQQNKVGLDRFLTLGPNLGIQRVPGIGLVYSNVASGVPPMFAHFVTNFPAFHQVVIFVTLETLLVPKVPANERFLISQVGSREIHILRCTVRYGYKDLRDSYDFESHIMDKAVEFLQRVDHNDEMFGSPLSPLNHGIDAIAAISENEPFALGRRRSMKSGELEEVEKLTEARQVGVAYMIGNTCVVPRKGSFFLKKLAIDIYGFLRQNCRRPAVSLGIPHTSLIEVGMIYHV